MVSIACLPTFPALTLTRLNTRLDVGVPRSADELSVHNGESAYCISVLGQECVFLIPPERGEVEATVKIAADGTICTWAYSTERTPATKQCNAG